MNAEIETLVFSVFGERALSRSKLYEWIRHFQERREAVLNDKREGCLRMVRTPSVIALETRARYSNKIQ